MQFIKGLSTIFVPSSILLVLLVLDIGTNLGYFHQFKWAIALFFFVLSLVIKLFLDFVYYHQPDKFQFYFLATSTFRMLLSVTFFATLILVGINRENLASFTVTFLIHYFLYLFFEIYFLLSKLRAKN